MIKDTKTDFEEETRDDNFQTLIELRTPPKVPEGHKANFIRSKITGKSLNSAATLIP